MLDSFWTFCDVGKLKPWIGPKAKYIKSNTEAVVVVVVDTFSILFVLMSISPAHHTQMPVHTGLSMVGFLHSLKGCGIGYFSSACSWNPVWPIVSNRTRNDGVPTCLGPQGLEQSVMLLLTKKWGMRPFAPTLHGLEWSIPVTGCPSGIGSPSCSWFHCGYLLRAREQGQALNKWGRTEWRGQHIFIFGWWWIIIVFGLSLSLSITKSLSDTLCISSCDSI